MKDKIIEKLKDKKIAILGFGREGKATYKFIREFLPKKDIVIIDKNDVSEDELVCLDTHLSFIYGNEYLSNLGDYDYVIKTPGISLKDVDTSGVNITSEIELVLEVAKDRVIGITGTKGKSTTSSLIYSILKKNGVDAVFAGNIGIPVFQMLDQVNDETMFVIEMSSHQLEYLNVSPYIGIVLNLFEDHLDHAGSVKHYHEIKMNMFRNQNENDYMIYCSDNEALNKMVNTNHFKGKQYNVNMSEEAITTINDDMICYKGVPAFSKDIKRNLLGLHNLENIMVAFTVSKILNLNDNLTLEAISEFKPLEYRLECIGELEHVKYYVDTLATIPSATIEAIEALDDINTLIFGGMDRGISYEGFAEYLNNTKIEHFICMPTTGHKIGADLDKERTYFVETLEEACKLAKEITKKGTSCILSPAAASYEHFKNYAEKGDKYKEYILN